MPRGPRTAVRFPEKLHHLAAALAGGAASATPLRLVAGDLDLLERNRVTAAVAHRAGQLEGAAALAEPLRPRLHLAAARVTILIETLRQVADVLGAAGVPWTPIKGGDLAFRAYDLAEDRDFGDLDILVAERHRATAATALAAAGWRPTFDETHPVIEQYLRDEEYCAPFVGPFGLLLELHYRLWGAAPAGLADGVLAESAADPQLAPLGRRITGAHAFIVAGFHVWTVPPPRAISNWWDLQRLASRGGATFAASVVAAARRWGVQLPVGMAAATAASLWPEEALSAIANQLLVKLRPSERALAAWGVRRGPDNVPYGSVVLARLLARRPSRHGWRSVWRRIWPHPAVRLMDGGA